MKQGSLLTSFWAAADNCVAVAFIKTMLAGKHCRTRMSNGKRFVFMKDGMIFSFTGALIKKMNAGNGIRFRRHVANQQRRRQVETLFALLVLQLQLHGYNGNELTQSAAKKLLVAGIDTRLIHRWLGVKQTRRRLKKPFEKYVGHLPAILVFNQRHIAFSAGGYFDDGGVAVPLDMAPTRFPYGEPTHYYVLR